MSETVPHIPLSQYLGRIQAALKASIPESCWVVAEMSEIKHSRQGHLYLDLLESADGREVARARGVAFANIAKGILQQWHQATGGMPQPGMKLMVNVKAEFNVQYGFSLKVLGIDPAYTLGDLEIQRQRVIAGLKEKGWYDRQRQLPSPTGYWRIAVIAPGQAAGLADFRRDADRLAEAGVCDFDYFSAVFQGKTSSESIRDALAQVHQSHQEQPYDVVCIIRGGGAKGDLAWLDDGNLASWVCRFPVPVYTGIGHEVDECVLDLVARRRFDTPSKVIGYFRYVFQREAEAIRFRVERISNGLIQMIQGHRHWLEQVDPRFSQQVRQQVSQQRNRLMSMHSGFGQNVQQVVSRQRMAIQQVDARFGAGAKALVAKERSRLELTCKLYDKTNPLALLDRGFALARNDQGRIVSSAKDAIEAGQVTLQFGDGAVTTIVQETSSTAKAS
jgi:exodeoxyribonuclease VII large subunit